MSPTSAVLPDDRRHHDYPNHDYLDHDYPEHDYLDPRWCGNYGGLNPTSLSSFLVSVGHQVRSKLILSQWFSSDFTAISSQLTLLRLDSCHVATLDVLEKVCIWPGTLD